MLHFDVNNFHTKSSIIERSFSQESCGWKGGVYHKRTSQDKPAKAAVRSDGIKFSTSHFLEASPMLDNDPKTIGDFEYLCGTYFICSTEAKNYHVTITIKNLENSKARYQAIVNQLSNHHFILAENEEKKICFDCFLSKDTLELTFKRDDSIEGIGELLLKEISLEEFQENAATGHKIFLLSDSTVQSYGADEYPQGGWGEYLCYFLSQGHKFETTQDQLSTYPQPRIIRSKEVVVINKAIGGRSSRSFIEEGKLREVLKEIRKNDYVIVQWGDNDATPIRPMRYTAPEEFQHFIAEYIKAILARDAVPVLVTPPPQNKFEHKENASISFQAYRDVMIEMARHYQIHYIDLGKKGAELLSMAGTLSDALFMKFPKRQYKTKVCGADDNTHFNKFGAKKMAEIVAAEFVKIFPEFTYYPDRIIQEELKSLKINRVTVENEVSLNWESAESFDYFRVDRKNGEIQLAPVFLLHPHYVETEKHTEDFIQYEIAAYTNFKKVAVGYSKK